MVYYRHDDKLEFNNDVKHNLRKQQPFYSKVETKIVYHRSYLFSVVKFFRDCLTSDNNKCTSNEKYIIKFPI